MRIHSILLASLLAGLFACSEETPTELAADSTVQQALIAQEIAKWDLFFGTAADRQTVVGMFADDFTSVQYGPGGVARVGKPEMAQGLSFLPQ